MKKMYKYILILTLMMFVFVGEVRANTELNDCVSNGTCELLCSYISNDGNAYIYKYIRSSEDVSYFSSFNWNKQKNIKKGYIFNTGNYVKTTGEYHVTSGAESWNKTAFIKNDLIKAKDNFICPKKVYKNNNKEVCYDNDDGYCKDIGNKKFKTAMSGVQVVPEKKQTIKDVKLNAEKAKEKVEKYFKDTNAKSEIIELCVFNNNDVVEGTADQIFVVTLKDKFNYFTYYNVAGDEKFTKFVEGTYDGVTRSSFIKFNNWGASCLAISNVYENQSSPLGSVYVTLSDKKDNTMGTISTEYSSDGNPYDSLNRKPGEVPEEPKRCEDLLGEDLRNEINSYLLYIKVAVPIIIIVMGSLDFGKAFISSDEDSMKKAQKKFIMRLIIGMVIFFLPALVNILLNIANQVWGISKGTCGITF